MPEPDEAQFRDWLRSRLRARGMSIRLLAQRSGTSASTVSRIVRGERRASLQTALRLMRVLRESTEIDPSSPRSWPDHRPTDPVSEVERALRADERLQAASVRRIMLLYHALRNDADLKDDGEALDRVTVRQRG